VTEINNTSVIEVQKKALFWERGIAFTFGPFLHFTGILFQCNKKELITLCEQDKIGISVVIEVNTGILN